MDEARLVPYSTLYYAWSPKGHDTVWVRAGIEYSTPIPSFQFYDIEQLLTVYAEPFYNDGYESFDVDAGWGHVQAGVSTTFDLLGMDFTPGVHYQWTMEDTLNTDKNELWFAIKVARQF